MGEAGARPPTGYRALRGLARLYPFMSGCGTLANHPLTVRLAPPERRIEWARLRGGGGVLAPLDDFVGRAAWFCGDLDPKITALVRRFLRPGDVFLDIGANLGVVTVPAARAVGRAGRVHAFEPNPEIAGLLRRSLAKNELSNVTVHECALGRTEERLTLVLREHNAGASALSRRAGDAGVIVPVRRLDDLAREAGIDRVDMIKLDIEGFEAEALAGAEALIGSARPRAILFEEHGCGKGAEPETFRLLKGLGYRVHAIERTLLRLRLGSPETVRAHDFLALSDAD